MCGDLALLLLSTLAPSASAASGDCVGIHGKKEAIGVEVVDLRTIVPLDVETMAMSAEKTGRVLIVHEAMKRGGVAGEIAFRLQEDAPDVAASLKAPIQRLAAMNLPLSGRPEWNLTPSADSIVTKVKEMVGEPVEA